VHESTTFIALALLKYIFMQMHSWKGLVGLLCPQGWADNIFCKHFVLKLFRWKNIWRKVSVLIRTFFFKYISAWSLF
jgi:hypothetical protein